MILQQKNLPKEAIEKATYQYSGYIESSHINANNRYDANIDDYDKTAEYTIRIPKQATIEFKDQIGAIGTLITESTEKENITKEYRDKESRIKLLEEKEKRLLNMLENTEEVEDQIQIEDRLAEVIKQKELMKTDVLSMDRDVQYTTVHISIFEIQSGIQAQTNETTFSQRLRNALTQSFSLFKVLMEDLLIAIIFIFPYLIIIALILIVLIKIINRKNHKNRRSKNDFSDPKESMNHSEDNKK